MASHDFMENLNMEIFEAAKAWASQELKIVPVKLRVDEKGDKVVQPFWRWQNDPYPGFENLQWAGANAYAVVLGQTERGWLAYADCDADQPLPEDPFSLLIRRFPEISETYIERTPHGFHVFVYIDKQPADSNINLKNTYGLELHVNGLCFMAPSRYEAGEYAVYNNAKIAKVSDFCQKFKAAFALEKNEQSWFDRKDLAFKPYEGSHPPCIYELLKGVDQGQRNEAAIRLSSYLVNFRGIEPKKALSQLKSWNKLNNPGLPETELIEVFKSSLRGYVFGCADSLLKTYCNEGVFCPLRKKQEKQQPEQKAYNEETIFKAKALLKNPAFFYRLGKVFEEGFAVPKLNKPRFVIGEERNKRLLGPLLIGASKLGMTSIIKVLGESGTAKDTMLRMWLTLLPINNVERSYITAASLRYSPDMQEADLLYIPDSPELKGEVGRHLRFMRADDGGLVSEYAMRDQETGEMTTKVVSLPIKGLATTSNAITGDPALESGMWTLTTDPSLELTKRVKEEKLKLRAGERPLICEDELNIWKCAFKILVEENQQAIPIVPFAKQLITLLESERSESRRDPDKLCDLISLVAWMRRFQKEPDKRAEADLVDLYFALQLGLDAISQTISELSPKEQQIFNAVKAKGTATCRDVADATKIPYKTCYNYLEKLVEKGYLNQDSEKNRNVYSVLSEKTPKTFLFFTGRNVESPEQLLEVVLNVIRNSSTSHPDAVSKYFFVDPILGDEIKVVLGEETQINIEKLGDSEKKYSPNPDEKWRSSERGEQRASDSENKPSLLLLAENRTENSFEDLASETKEFVRLTDNSGTETCALCGVEGRMDWQAMLFDGSWGLLCEACGFELSKRLNKSD